MHRLGAVLPLIALTACSPPAVGPRTEPPEGEAPAVSATAYVDPQRLHDMAFTLGGFPVVHQVPKEQADHMLVPVYVEFAPEAGVTHAVVMYRAFEEYGYSPVQMKKLGKGFGVELPCEAVLRPGLLRLYIKAILERSSDGYMQELGSLGSEQQPFLVYIKPTITGPPPALPGQKPSEKKCSCIDCNVPGWILDGTAPPPGN